MKIDISLLGKLNLPLPFISVKLNGQFNSIDTIIDTNESDRIKLINNVLSVVENDINVLLSDLKINKTPHKCPVCNGSGSEMISEQKIETPEAIGFKRKYAHCHACEGRGIVWG